MAIAALDSTKRVARATQRSPHLAVLADSDPMAQLQPAQEPAPEASSEKRSRALPITLILIGALLVLAIVIGALLVLAILPAIVLAIVPAIVLAIVAIVILLATRPGTTVEAARHRRRRRHPSATSASPTPTTSATPTAIASPTRTAVPPPPSSGCDLRDLLRAAQRGMLDGDVQKQLTFSWSSANAARAHIGGRTANAKTAPYASDLPPTGTYADLAYNCSQASRFYTATLEDAEGRLNDRTVTITKQNARTRVSPRPLPAARCPLPAARCPLPGSRSTPIRPSLRDRGAGRRTSRGRRSPRAAPVSRMAW